MTLDRAWHDAAETVTEADQRGGGPCVGREDEPEHRYLDSGPAPKFRKLSVQLPADTVADLTALAKSSGLAQTHFLTTSLVLGARTLSRRLKR